MATWRLPREIFALAEIAAAERKPGGPNSEVQGPRSRSIRHRTLRSARVVRIGFPIVEISATDIRDRVRRGASIRFRVPAAVEAYIRRHGLYRR